MEQFQRLMLQLDYPMTVVTAAVGDSRSGCLVGFTTQTSVDPPRYVVCLSQRNHTFRIAGEAQHLGVHFLGVDDVGIARLFGEETGDEVDKFSRCRWTPGPEGVPLIDDLPSRFVGRVLGRFPVGDHHAFLLEPLLAETAELTPLGFQSVKHMQAGHAP